MEVSQPVARRRFSAQDVVVGLVLILFGSVLLLHQTDILPLEEFGVRSVWSLWPFILVVIGVGKLADAPTFYHIGNGVWWIFIGLWLYVSIQHVYGLSFSDTWPALLVAWGVSLMWESLTKSKRGHGKEYGCGY